MNPLRIICYLILFLGLELFSVPTSAETVDHFKNNPTSQTDLLEVSDRSKVSYFYNDYSVEQQANFTREIKLISDEKKVFPKSITFGLNFKSTSS